MTSFKNKTNTYSFVFDVLKHDILLFIKPIDEDSFILTPLDLPFPLAQLLLLMALRSLEQATSKDIYLPLLD
jgi:hypothetical protein